MQGNAIDQPNQEDICMNICIYIYIYIYIYMYKPGTAEKKKKNGRSRLFLLGFNLMCLEYTPPPSIETLFHISDRYK